MGYVEKSYYPLKITCYAFHSHITGCYVSGVCNKWHHNAQLQWTPGYRASENVSRVFVWLINNLLKHGIWCSSAQRFYTGIQSGVFQTSMCWDSWPMRTEYVWRGLWVTDCSLKRLCGRNYNIIYTCTVFHSRLRWRNISNASSLENFKKTKHTMLKNIPF